MRVELIILSRRPNLANLPPELILLREADLKAVVEISRKWGVIKK